MIAKEIIHAVCLALTCCSPAAIAQDVDPAREKEKSPQSDKDPGTVASTPAPQSTERSMSASPDDVGARLGEAQERITGFFDIKPLSNLHRRWEHFNNDLLERFDFSMGFNFTLLYQHASESRGRNDAAAGDLDFYGSWQAIDFGGKWPGRAVFSLEGRHRIGSLTPAELGPEIGTLFPTVVGFNSQRLSVIELYWQQGSYEDGFTGRAGRMDPALLYDSGRYVSANYAFLSPAYSDTPTMPLPAPGLGVAGLGAWGDVYLLGGIHDGKGDRTDSGLDSFDANELFAVVELGGEPGHGTKREGLYHLTLWHSDARSSDDVPRGRGFALTLEQQVGREGLTVPFVRYSYGDGGGTPARQLLAVGTGVEKLFGQPDGFFGIAASWAQPTDRSLRDQYVLETFARLYLTPFTHLTPDIQWIVHPSNAPETDSVWVFSLRLRTLF